MLYAAIDIHKHAFQAAVLEYRLGAHGWFVRYPRTCDNGARNAARWRGNVRAIVRCGDGADAALRRVAAALGRL